MPKTKLATQIFAWMVVTRAPFLSATVIPILAAAAWVAARGIAVPFPWLLFSLALIGGVALHISANTFNDYFDWRSGTDKVNNNYFMPYSGGSRSLELGLISERRLIQVAWLALGTAVLAGLPFFLLRGPVLLLFGLAGAFSAYYYTAPPLRLAARKGLGELVVGLNFGPLMVAGTVFALTGQLSWLDFFVGLPIGLLTTAILWINQFPDMEADAQTGKLNLVVILGKQRARWGYVLLMVAAFGSTLLGVLLGYLPYTALLMLAGLPLAVYATRILFRHYEDRTLIKANSTTILLHMVAGLLLAVGLFMRELV
jgi:1,4-dihydroxy-2-naphthoate polyprenyltransferase